MLGVWEGKHRDFICECCVQVCDAIIGVASTDQKHALAMQHNLTITLFGEARS
jgi:hypothetical protein